MACVLLLSFYENNLCYFEDNLSSLPTLSCKFTESCRFTGRCLVISEVVLKPQMLLSILGNVEAFMRDMELGK